MPRRPAPALQQAGVHFARGTIPYLARQSAPARWGAVFVRAAPPMSLARFLPAGVLPCISRLLCGRKTTQPPTNGNDSKTKTDAQKVTRACFYRPLNGAPSGGWKAGRCQYFTLGCHWWDELQCRVGGGRARQATVSVTHATQTGNAWETLGFLRCGTGIAWGRFCLALRITKHFAHFACISGE